ncbi:PREDICTED: protein MEN-8 [Theobroma cacao]|uniref:Protein MEN-8 n=1 Tax=Theobroma cacao TaxID=3641 RepID=A0AB32W3G2_THECC|nr:PREDICTED: protein MEN-8 [Theobroma cacao]
MAILRSLLCLISWQATALLLLLAVAAVQSQTAKAQSCPNELNRLNVCAPFVVPGVPEATPSSDCCAALQSVQHDCLCNTLRIASRLPSRCNIPALSCGN